MKSRLQTLEKLLNDTDSFVFKDSPSQLLTTDEMKQMGLSGYSIHDLNPDKFYPLIKKDKIIKKLRLLIPIPIKQSSAEFQTILYISYNDGTKESLCVAPNRIRQFHDHIRIPNYTYVRMASPQLNWESKGISPHYTEETHKYYQSMENQLSNIIRAKKKNLNIVDIGCGEGSFLIDKIESIPDISWIGVDLSVDNINRAKEKVREKKDPTLEMKEGHFIVGNMLDINAIIAKAFQEKQLTPNIPIIITSLGSITRLVLPNGFVAAKVFQELHQIKNLECILGCGVGEPLITQHIAKRVGFELKIAPPPDNSYFLKKLDEKSILVNKIKKIENSNILDLSLSPIPEKWLTHPVILNKINENKKPIEIDISYCKLTEPLLCSLSNIMKRHQPGEIKLIYLDTDAEQIRTFNERFTPYKDLIQTNHINSSEDILLSASKRFFDVVNVKDYIQRNIEKISNMFLELKELQDESSEKKEFKKIYAHLDKILTNVRTNTLENVISQLENDPWNIILRPAMRLVLAYAHLKTAFSPTICKLIYNYSSSLVETLKIFLDHKQEIPNQLIDFLETHNELTSAQAKRIAIFWIELIKHSIKDKETFFKSDIIHHISRLSDKQLPLYTAGISSHNNMRELYAYIKELEVSYKKTKDELKSEAKENKVYDYAEDNESFSSDSESLAEETPEQNFIFTTNKKSN